VLGLGPIWMSRNEGLKRRAAAALRDGGIFAFGLSEKAHGADVYSSEMALTPCGEGRYTARGRKYYIGNANAAAMVSVFGKLGDEYVFFAVDPRHDRYGCVQNVVASQNFVAEFALHDYPVTEADILSRGEDAWNAALNTVNIGKFNLGWASIGICTHAFYEAIDHAAGRRLYGMAVTDFPHVKQMFVDAYTRLVAMKLVALRAADYMRAASSTDRRYLLYNPIVKMKVTTQGEEVINLLWDVIAAKGFEKDTYFEMAARDIRGLPKLEGTVHVNIALIVKFIPSYFLNHAPYPAVPRRDEPVNDDFLFDQGPARGLGKIAFHDNAPVFESWDVPNVRLFREQLAAFGELMSEATPDDAQRKDLDFLMALGEIFVQIVYAQLVLENARLYAVDEGLVDQIFDGMVRDVSRFALQLYGKARSTPAQMDRCLRMIRKPAVDEARYEHVWRDHVLPMHGAYRMND
jgi:acyl-CoA dehydrogenase